MEVWDRDAAAATDPARHVDKLMGSITGATLPYRNLT